jgi:hypothetical protein
LLNEEISIYPNPAKDYFVLQSGQMLYTKYAVDMYNLQGVLVTRLGEVNNLSPVDISYLPEGLYVLGITADDGTFFTKRIVITN